MCQNIKCKTCFDETNSMTASAMTINLIKYLSSIDSFDSDLIDSFSSLSCSNWMFFQYTIIPGQFN